MVRSNIQGVGIRKVERAHIGTVPQGMSRLVPGGKVRKSIWDSRSNPEAGEFTIYLRKTDQSCMLIA